ncbi:late competence development ComFB family protein [Caproiciproducens sp. CPB-2]|uniref:late competence development ComFB family protein n=1 Tax=Caproiciproducens sp. CPB-2 TaxID=3030017 RepID=UPI0023DAD561|nr:late competence development ComFB family protein [Caproiciproducens sp. CPB-2]MDF1495717.1 late competence development ComFB family protein [Caproiciproducens sp. CPB-2]
MGVKLKNLMESLLLTKMDEVIDKLDCCKCEKCRMDIASYALNRLPPKYVATYEGEVYSKLDTLSTQYETDLLNALFQAAKVVSENPHHNLSAEISSENNTQK